MINVIKPNPRGQIIIPSKMREDLVEGKEFVIVSDNESFILKANPLGEKEKEDLEFAEGTRKAWIEIEEGKCTTMEFDDFIEEMEKW